MKTDSTLNLVWWRPHPRLGIFPRRKNLGDELSRFIVQSCASSLGNGSFRTGRRLLAIGSILHHARDGDVVWGSGHHGGKALDKYNFHDIDVRAVRGPLTAQLLTRMGVDAPSVMGDPAILLPLFMPKPVCEVRRKVVVIPHYWDSGRVATSMPILRTYGSNIRRFVAELSSADMVISASLHGIIISEAYGIPSILVTNARSETLHKYTDYYESTGRFEYPSARSYDEALLLRPPPLPNLAEMQAQLLQAFPLDLWNESAP